MSVKIVLNMIVKNESKIIRRCLEAAAPILDGVVISDTGSTDNTVEIIREFCREKHLKHRIVTDEPWKNFGHNRTIALQAASQFVKYDPLTYLLMIDADMVLKIEPAFQKELLLFHDKWNVEQRAGGMSYWNPRLARASKPWRSVGVTHEYLDQAPETTEARLPANLLWIDDCNDGGSKSDKSARDIALLEEGLKQEPHNVRYMFYLGNTYREVGQFAKAIRWYMRHREESNWPEEKWYAAYYMALCYEGLHKWDKAVEWFLLAYGERPERCEPLFYLANHYRIHNKPAQGYPYALAAAQIPFPQDELLFINRSLYEYECRYELSICGFYAGASGRREAQKNTYQLLSDPKIPHYMFDSVLWNLRFLIQPLSQFVKKSPVFEPLTLKHKDSSQWHACNPSIARQMDETTHEYVWGKPHINVRAVNYTQKQARNYQAPNNVFQTENELDGEPLLPAFRGPYHDSCQVRGIEDVRLFQCDGELWASATCLEMIPQNLPQIVLIDLSENHRDDPFVRPLKWKTPREPQVRTEKNWLFFNPDYCQMRAIYGFENNQLTILDVDRRTGLCDIHKVVQHPNLRTSHWKGSAGPVFFDPSHGQAESARYLILVHFTIDRAEERRYYHQFVICDDCHFQILAVSPPFVFRNDTDVEMCLSMTLDQNAETLTVAYGYGDREAYLVHLPFHEIIDPSFCCPLKKDGSTAFV